MNIELTPFIKRFLPWDSLVYVSVAVGVFSVVVLYVTSFTFFLYLYQPVFWPVDSVFLLTPSIDYDLLTKAVEEDEIRQKRMEEELQKTYPDPFEVKAFEADKTVSSNLIR